MPIVIVRSPGRKTGILELRSRKPANAIREIVRTCLSENGKENRQSQAFLKQVLERERAHPSVVENTVVFPHARTDLVDEIVAGVGRSRAGIPFGENQQRAHLIFVIGVPERLISDY